MNDVELALKEIMEVISEATGNFRTTIEEQTRQYPEKVNDIFSESWDKTLGRYRRIASATD